MFFNTDFGQKASYPMGILVIISLEKNHSGYLSPNVWIRLWHYCLGYEVTQFSRNASYVWRNSLHPTQGSKRESLAHPHAQCEQRDSFQLLDTALHKSDLQSGGGVDVFCFDCVVVQKDLVFLQIFFSPLSFCLHFFCLFL